MISNKTSRSLLPLRPKSLRGKRQVISKIENNQGNGDWRKFNYYGLCENLEEWACKTIIAENNLAFQILRSLCNIKFTNLKHLFLAHNRIQTIQNLCQAQMPCLQLLSLNNNQIVSFKSLRRFHFLSLKQLNLENNKAARDIELFVAGNYPCLKQISLQYYAFNKTAYEDACFLAKIGNQQIKAIYLDGSDRIVQLRLIKLLRKRYPAADIAEELYYSENSSQSSQDFSENLQSRGQDDMSQHENIN